MPNVNVNKLAEDTKSMLAKFASKMSRADFIEILEEHGARRHYIPKVTDFLKVQRNDWIRVKFKGDYESLQQLVWDEWKVLLSIRQLRRILA